MKAHEILTEALRLLDDGRRWGKFPGDSGIPMFGEGICPNVAIIRVLATRNISDLVVCSRVWDAIQMAAVGRSLGIHDSGIPDWNDAPERTFADVKAAFCRAIEATTPRSEAEVQSKEPAAVARAEEAAWTR